MAGPTAQSSSSSSSSPGTCDFSWDAANHKWVQTASHCASGFTCPTPDQVLAQFGQGQFQGQQVHPNCLMTRK
jgi:hypothetical protein